MLRYSFAACMLIAALAVNAQADAIRLYMGGQWGSGSPIAYQLKAYDLSGNLQSPTFATTGQKQQGIAVSPLDHKIYVSFDSTTGAEIRAYDPATGQIEDVAELGKKISGMCFDGSGNLYASNTSDKEVYKLTPKIGGGFDVDDAWNTLPATGSTLQANDMVIRNGKMYLGRYYGITVCDLTGANAGVESWLVEVPSAPNGILGVAFDDSGTLYTTVLGPNPKEVWQWNSDFTAHTTIGTFETNVQDIDYYDGYLYLKANKTGTGMGVFRYDLNAKTPTWDLLVSDGTGMGWIDIAPVPEPGTLALLAAGLVGLLAYAWRRRR